MSGIDDVRAAIKADRFTAHTLLFAHRHEYPMAPFHRHLVDDFWTDQPFMIDLGFRESGKTTLVEEAVTIAACEGAFRNCVIVGAKEGLAAELLTNIKAELSNNDMLAAVYPEMVKNFLTWTATKVEFADGRCIQAIGRDQAVRGTRHRNWRPDFVVINDFEDDDAVLTAEGRRRTLRWVLKVLLPACDRTRRRIRIYDTVRDADAVPMMLHKHGWPARLIPICYLDDEGELRPSWTGHPTMTQEWIEAERSLYARLGELDIWEREYMCSATARQGDRTFSTAQVVVRDVPRAWQPVYAAIDPAMSGRRSNSTLAGTGWAVWSWSRHELIVWEAGRRALLPSEIIDLAFRLYDNYGLVELGVEATSLEQFLMQPLREEGLRRRVVLPVNPLSAIVGTQGQGKDRFIAGLEPFYTAGQVIWAQDFPDLREELDNFPIGKKDALNALAYALVMRPGRLMYEGWNPNAHIDPVEGVWGRPYYLAVNATKASVTAALMQVADGQVAVLADYISEGDAGEALAGIVREASLRTGGGLLTPIAGRDHFEQWSNVGLVQAVRQLGLECRSGGDVGLGRKFLRREMSKTTPLGQAFVVSPAAHWTLRALAGGYSRPLKDAVIGGGPAENHYKTLIEGVEAMCGLLAFGVADDEGEVNYAIAPDGRQYRSALPARMMMRH